MPRTKKMPGDGEAKARVTRKPRAKKSELVDDIGSLAKTVGRVAQLATSAEERKVGIHNYGSPIWFTDRKGVRRRIAHNGTVVTDEFTWTSVLMQTPAYKDGRLVRDDSALISTDIPGAPTPSSPNAMSDAEIKALVKGEESDAIEHVKSLTSLYTVSRILEVAKTARPKRYDLVDVCEEKIFMIMNDIPSHFDEMNMSQLANFIEDRGLDIRISVTDNPESLRGKILAMLA